MEIAEEHWTPIRSEALQVGHYIRIDHRWLDHPFLRKTFRIASQDEIDTIRDAGLTRLFIDLARSEGSNEAASQRDMAGHDHPGQQAPGQTAAQTQTQTQMQAEVTVQPATSPGIATQFIDETVAHAVEVKVERRALAIVQARYDQNVQRATQLLDMLEAVDPRACEAVAGQVNETVDLLLAGSAPLTLVAAAPPQSPAQRVALMASDAVSLAGTMGKRMGLAKAELRTVATAAALHVCGLLRLPPYLVDEKPTGPFRVSPTFRQYPVLSAQIMEECGGFSDEAVRVVREHRERPSGVGFPAGLSAQQIHPLALMLGAIREFQVQCAADGATPAQALAHMYKHTRPIFGDSIVNHLIAAMTVYPPGTFVLLSDGSIGRVLRVNETERMRPIVSVYGGDADPVEPDILDLAREHDLSIQRFVDVTVLPQRIVDQMRGSWSGLSLSTPDENGVAAPVACASL